MKRGRNIARKGIRSEELIEADSDFVMRPSVQKTIEDLLSEAMTPDRSDQEEVQKFKLGGDVRYNSKRGKCY
jgi:hypothetical protein